jgi:hypothetical protein
MVPRPTAAYHQDMIPFLQDFLLWCALVNGAVLLLWTGMMILAPKLTYKTQTTWFPMKETEFRGIMYRLIGIYKMLFIVFNLAPLIAVHMM